MASSGKPSGIPARMIERKEKEGKKTQKKKNKHYE